MKNSGSRNLVLLVVSVSSSLLIFYGFLAIRARLWSPLWAIKPTEKVFASSMTGPSPAGEESPVEHGRLLYSEYGCGICHGPHGEGGVKNPNADANPPETVKNLLDLEDYFTSDDLKEIIREGVEPAKLDEDKPEPPLVMPAWRDIISEEELENLSLFIFTLISPPSDASGEEEE
jgi:mono/diheme cytochrome c family protein